MLKLESVFFQNNVLVIEQVNIAPKLKRMLQRGTLGAGSCPWSLAATAHTNSKAGFIFIRVFIAA